MNRNVTGEERRIILAVEDALLEARSKLGELPLTYFKGTYYKVVEAFETLRADKEAYYSKTAGTLGDYAVADVEEERVTIAEGEEYVPDVTLTDLNAIESEKYPSGLLDLIERFLDDIGLVDDSVDGLLGTLAGYAVGALYTTNEATIYAYLLLTLAKEIDFPTRTKLNRSLIEA